MIKCLDVKTKKGVEIRIELNSLLERAIFDEKKALEACVLV